MLIPAELNSEGKKMLIWVKPLTKYVIRIYALGSVQKSSASESKAFQSRSKGEIPGRARRKERLSRSKLKQAFLFDSDAELFKNLVQCIKFGSWEVRSLKRAQNIIQSNRDNWSMMWKSTVIGERWGVSFFRLFCVFGMPCYRPLVRNSGFRKSFESG